MVKTLWKFCKIIILKISYFWIKIFINTWFLRRSNNTYGLAFGFGSSLSFYYLFNFWFLINLLVSVADSFACCHLFYRRQVFFLQFTLIQNRAQFLIITISHHRRRLLSFVSLVFIGRVIFMRLLTMLRRLLMLLMLLLMFLLMFFWFFFFFNI